jgi:type I restriction enzyme S subunit
MGGKQIFELDPSNKKYLSLVHHRKRIKKQLELRENMTLITCSGTIGKVTLVPKHWDHWAASQHIIRVVPSANEIAGYLSIFLASDYGRHLITRYAYGSVVDEIDDNHVSQIPFPFLKDATAQAEINRLALQSNDLRYQAYQLEQEAMRVMEEEVIFAAK